MNKQKYVNVLQGNLSQCFSKEINKNRWINKNMLMYYKEIWVSVAQTW